MKLLTGIQALYQEAHEFMDIGTQYGFANPQSMTEGAYQGKVALVNGVRTVDMTRLDYLSLGQSDVIRKIMKDCIDRYNISCPTSQMALKSESTVRLERALADFHGMRDSVIYLSGYSTNENVIQALALRLRSPHVGPYVSDTGLGEATKGIPTEFFIDSESHYSIQYNIKLARQKNKAHCLSHIFPTTDYDSLRAKLDKSREERGDNAVRIIVSDTISSMSGKVYDVAALCEIAEEYDCLVYLDEAHAVGSYGAEGRGLASTMSEFTRYKDRLLIMGTLTKAFAQLGGYVAVADEALSCYLRACSPQYIFSAPLSPWMAEVVIRTLDVVRGEYGRQEREKLSAVSTHFKDGLNAKGFDTLGSASQIVPVFIGEEEKSSRVKAYLEQNGYTSSLFMCPGVPGGQSIIRFSLCSDITIDEVDEVIALLVNARRMFDF
ncbi:MAG: pyridoxal phosphate-dependent aminotransferase family protein [Nitrospirae bacterium]|nr:pyridoxal phosphate-dependent aminotransferase family protein [Nitrospirota bacterium]